MKKAHRHSARKMMRRTSRVYLNELNAGKARRVREFLHLCRDVIAYYVEMFWRAKDFSAELASLTTVHRACERFSITTRLSQALAKQAKEMVRSAHAQGKRKPHVRRHTITLYSHFVRIEPFRGSIEKHTHAQITSLLGRELKRVDLSTIRVLCVEDLKWVRRHTRGKFPRVLNRRLSHWLYATIIDRLRRACEEGGIRLARKNPAYTSMTCSVCGTCDRRSRVGDWFSCRHCGFSCDADLNAGRNLKRLGEAGVYGLRSLPSWRFA